MITWLQRFADPEASLGQTCRIGELVLSTRASGNKFCAAWCLAATAAALSDTPPLIDDTAKIGDKGANGVDGSWVCDILANVPVAPPY